MQHDPTQNEPTQNYPKPVSPPHRTATVRVLSAAVGLLAVGGVGAIVGHDAWGSTPLTTSAPLTPTTTPSSGTTPPTSNSGTSPEGTSGNSGTTGGGFEVPSGNSGSTGSNSDPFGLGAGNSGTGSGSSASGGPANAAAIASNVDPGLVDVNTQLGYESAAAAGTGMVLTANGEVLTNNHVVEGATSIRVTDIGNGRTYAAHVVGYDRAQDVAVLQLDNASGLQTVRLGNSNSLATGAGVVAIGNAGGVGGTPSYAGGSVTALNQSITASDASSGTSEQLTDLIATNADIQAGDSGGPLVNTSGEVIGMDTAGSAGNSGFQFEGGSGNAAQGFSIPINVATGIAEQIEAGTSSSTVHIGATPFLGVEISPSSATSSGGFAGNSGSVSGGAPISGVTTGGPAAEAGLVSGDTITSIDGANVASPNALSTIILSKTAGQSVTVGYLDSEGQQRSVTVTLASGPAQ